MTAISGERMADGTRAGQPTAVAFCLDNLGAGGTELNAVRLAERLDTSRYALHLFSLQADGPLLQRFRDAGAVHHPLPIKSLWGADAWRAGYRARAAIIAHDIRILHAHDLYTSILLVPWARSGGGRTATIASRRWWNPPSRKLGLLGRLTLPLAHRVVVNTPALAERVIAEEGARPGKVVVVPNFLDDAAIREPTPDERVVARQRYGIPADATVIGIVARLDPVKDHVILIEAFRQVAPRHPSAHLLLIGDGPERGRLEARVRASGFAGRITIAGHQSNAVNLHVASDISVLCSRHEGFPNSLVEAMGAARPVIASAVGGNLDAVQPGQTGLLFPVGSAGALAGCLTRLLENPSERHRMGLAGLEVARFRYSASTALARLQELYADLLPPSGKAW